VTTELGISHPLPVLDPLPVQGRGRPRGALGGISRPTNTRRLPSAFELPSSSAPPAINTGPAERLYIVQSGLTRLEMGHQDLYEPGTQRERGYMHSMSSLFDSESMVDPGTAVLIRISIPAVPIPAGPTLVFSIYIVGRSPTLSSIN
jgi:hypothetical protein